MAGKKKVAAVEIESTLKAVSASKKATKKAPAVKAAVAKIESPLKKVSAKKVAAVAPVVASVGKSKRATSPVEVKAKMVEIVRAKGPMNVSKLMASFPSVLTADKKAVLEVLCRSHKLSLETVPTGGRGRPPQVVSIGAAA